MRGRRGTKPLEPGAVHSSNSVYIVCVYESESSTRERDIE